MKFLNKKLWLLLIINRIFLFTSNYYLKVSYGPQLVGCSINTLHISWNQQMIPDLYLLLSLVTLLKAHVKKSH